MTKKPEILKTTSLNASRFFTIEELHLRFSNGQERHFERIKGKVSAAVMIVPMLDNNTVLLIREYGAGIHDYFLGLPKGIIEPQEEVFAAANRELMEEAGHGAEQFTLLKTTSLSPNYMTSTMHLVLAQHLYPKRLEGDEPEPLEVVPWKLDKLNELLSRDDFHEPRSIAALLLVRERLHHG